MLMLDRDRGKIEMEEYSSSSSGMMTPDAKTKGMGSLSSTFDRPHRQTADDDNFKEVVAAKSVRDARGIDDYDANDYDDVNDDVNDYVVRNSTSTPSPLRNNPLRYNSSDESLGNCRHRVDSDSAPVAAWTSRRGSELALSTLVEDDTGSNCGSNASSPKHSSSSNKNNNNDSNIRSYSRNYSNNSSSSSGNNNNGSMHSNLGNGGGEGGDRNIRFSTVSSERAAAAAAAKEPETPFKKPFNPEKEVDADFFNFWRYLEIEMFGKSVSDYNQSQEDGKKLNLIYEVPSKLMSFLTFGICICFDALLYVFTFMVIRFVLSIIRFITYSFYSLLNWLGVVSKSEWMLNVFKPSHAYDFMRGVIFVCGYNILFVGRLNTLGYLYHWIKGQNMIKLYQVAVVCEIIDKLIGNLGQESFDALFYCTKEFSFKWKSSLELLKYFLISLACNCVHCLLHFLYIITLMAAISNEDNLLLVIMFLNNFAEIKSSVFKKFDDKTLFPVVCNDVIEIFQLGMYIVCISLIQIIKDGEPVMGFVYMFGLLIFGEMAVDSVKYIFLMRFNNKLDPAGTFEAYEYDLRRKFLSSGDRAASRMIGISQIPLGCVFARLLYIVLTSDNFLQFYQSITAKVHWAVVISLAYFVLVMVKIGTGYALIRYSRWRHNKELHNRQISALYKED